ncbi:MAG: deoxyribonuclease IV [Candidatus Sumerlaeia bacterium]|nr:deoxyribonuclease IV [Candidatus Sumerlaeia bacterium]
MLLPPLGSHMSIAGGVDKSPERGASVHSTAMQIFVKNNNRWAGPPITTEQASRFASELKRTGIPVKHVFAHTCYLINLASPKPEVVEKSIHALKDELNRCQQIGLPGLVMHPGSHINTGLEKGIQQIIDLTLSVFEETPDVKTRLLFETTAGTGSNIGADFGELGAILKGIKNPKRAGVCLDTCHIFAAGYDIRTPETWQETMDAFDREVGFKNLHAVHINDSKHDLGSRKDRHEHIGEGKIGREAFRLLMTDPRFRSIPMSLETDKDDDLEDDRRNLALLYELGGEEYPG